MRLSTQQIHQRAVELMLEQQSRLAKTQQQLASGARFESAAEDPAGAVAAMRLEREIAATEQYQRNADTVLARQSAEENALASVTEVLHGVRELLVQGKNDTLSETDRKALGRALDQRLEELLGLANTRGGDGEYLFAGLQGHTRPFSHDGHGQFSYHGDQGQRELGIGPGVRATVNDSGAEVFQRVPAGNGTFVTAASPSNAGTGAISPGTAAANFVADRYEIGFSGAVGQPLSYQVRNATGDLVAQGEYVSAAAIAFAGAEVAVSGDPAPGDRFTIEPAGYRDIFSILHGASEALAGGARAGGAAGTRQAGLERGLNELDNALDHILLQRARVGARLNQVESQTQTNEATKLAAQEALSDARDLDYAEAATRLQSQIVGLEAAQRSYMSIQGLSLFRLL